jgi:hypothetical protein
VFENTAGGGGGTNSMGDASPFRHTQYSVSPSLGNGTLSANNVKNMMGTT